MPDDARSPFGLSLSRAELRAPDIGNRGTGGRGTGDRIGARLSDVGVAALVNRLHDVSGIRLDAFWKEAPKEKSWDQNTRGFHFMSERTAPLRAALVASGRFVATERADAPVQRFREINANPYGGSLHFEFSARADGPHTLHLDSYSIVPGRDPRTGAPVYSRSMPTLAKHVAVDLMGIRDDDLPW